MPYCIKCGHKNEPFTKFCTSCGNMLVAPATISGMPTKADKLPEDPTVTSAANNMGVTQQPPAPAFDAGRWFNKNRKFILSAVGILCIFWAVNYFFLKPHPEKDGKAAAQAECMCEEKRINDFVNKNKEFLQNFNSYHFASAYEARQKLDSLESNLQEQYNTCLQQTRLLQNDKMKKYGTNEEALNTYQQNYYTQKQLCNNNQNAELGKVAEAITNKFSDFSPYIPPAQHLSENKPDKTTDTVSIETAPTDQQEISNGALTDDFIKNQISSLYTEENNISSSPDDINKIMSYYDFPLIRYYDAKNVSIAALFKIYSDSYLKSLSFHKVEDFQDRMTISRQTDGSTKVIVGCRFEFSTVESPDTKRSRKVFNVYVLGKNGKIKSVYQLLKTDS